MSGVNRGITHSSRGKSREAGENLVSGKRISSKIVVDIRERNDYIKFNSMRKGETQDGPKAIDLESAGRAFECN